MLSAEPKAEADNSYRDLDYSGYQKTDSKNCFISHCFEENNDKHRRKEPELTLFLEIMHCAPNLQISERSASR